MSKNRPVDYELHDGLYLYRAEIDPRIYFPNHGDFIQKFQTPSEIDRMTILESIKEVLGETVFNKVFIEQSLKELADETILNPGWVADKALSLLCFLMEGQAPRGTGDAAMEMNKRIRKAYQMTVVDPRTGLSFPMPQDIELHDLRWMGDRGVLVEQKLATNQIPYYLAQIWIVSDEHPNVVNRKGLKQGGKSFVCFSEKDAKNLIESIKKNQDSNSKLEKFKEISLNADYEKISREAHHSILDGYVVMLDDLHNQFEAFIQRQNEYKADMEKIKNEFGLNQAGDRQTIWRALFSLHDYPHFEQIEKIFAQIQKCKELNALRKNMSYTGESSYLNFTLREAYRELQFLMTMLANYIKSHPYQPADSLVRRAFEECLNQMKDINAEIAKDISGKTLLAENESNIFEDIESKHGAKIKEAIEEFYIKKIVELRKSETYKSARSEERRNVESVFLNMIATLDFSKINHLPFEDDKRFYAAMQDKEHWTADMEMFMSKQMNISHIKRGMDNPSTMTNTRDQNEKHSLNYHEAVFQELKFVLQNKYTAEYLVEKFRALQNYINFQRNPNSKNYIAYQNSIDAIMNDKQFINANENIQDFLANDVLKKMDKNNKVQLEETLKGSTKQSKEDQKVLMIFALNNFIYEVKDKIINRKKYQEIIAAQAYKNFLLKPSQQNYEELKLHKEAVDGSDLAEIVKAIEAMKIKVTPQASPEWNTIKNRCIEKLQTYLSVLEKESFNWNKDSKAPAAQAYINWLQNMTPETKQELQKHEEALNDGRLKDAIADVKKYHADKDTESEGSRPKFH